jgi:carbon storage regulator
MLVLSRKPGEKIVICDNITITVVSVIGNKVRLAFEAPNQVRIMREELLASQDGPMLDPDLERKPLERQEGISDLALSRSQR